jgi:methionyl-tRNA formyltransferase
MIMKGSIPITERDTAQSLHDALARMGAELMVQAINKLQDEGRLDSIPQDESLVTYAHKLDKSEAVMDWNKNADELSRQVRAFNPFPVAQTFLSGKPCRIWMAQATPGKAMPGMVADVRDGITVGCGEGLLKIEELQMPGGKRMAAREFLAGHPLKVGDRFSSAEI